MNHSDVAKQGRGDDGAQSEPCQRAVGDPEKPFARSSASIVPCIDDQGCERDRRREDEEQWDGEAEESEGEEPHTDERVVVGGERTTGRPQKRPHPRNPADRPPGLSLIHI